MLPQCGAPVPATLEPALEPIMEHAVADTALQNLSSAPTHLGLQVGVRTFRYYTTVLHGESNATSPPDHLLELGPVAP